MGLEWELWEGKVVQRYVLSARALAGGAATVRPETVEVLKTLASAVDLPGLLEAEVNEFVAHVLDQAGLAVDSGQEVREPAVRGVRRLSSVSEAKARPTPGGTAVPVENATQGGFTSKVEESRAAHGSASPTVVSIASGAGRSEILRTVRAYGAESHYKCPVCSVSIRGRNLVGHWDKNHGTRVRRPPIRRIAVTQVSTERSFEVERSLQKVAVSERRRRVEESASTGVVRERIKELARGDGIESLHKCPICHAQVKGRKFVLHFDRQHG